MNLEQFSDSELQQELIKRREQQVLKTCIICEGLGKIPTPVILRTSPQENTIECLNCKGKSTIIAYRSKS